MSLFTSDVIENFLNLTSAFLLGLVLFVVDVPGISDRFASALLGTVFGLALHPIKNRMEHALRRFGPPARRRSYRRPDSCQLRRLS